MAITDGAVVQSSFDAAARSRIAAERTKVELALAPEIDAAYPRAWGAQVRVETADGRTFEAVRRDAKGDPENPVTAAELSVKARALLAGGGMSGGDADALVATILALPQDRPVRDLALFGHHRAGRAAAARSA
jgi:2-methylcitrate dehydratase PrpD